MTPDWIPNIHPLIVHFPIALLIVAVIFDVARLFFKKQSWIQNTVLALYSTGTIGLMASFISGRDAVETVVVSGDAISVVTTHEDWALYTLIYFSIFTLLRLWTWWKNLEVNHWISSGLIVLAFAGIGMLWRTGDLGTQLVYKHGVAVIEIDRLEEQIESLRRDLSELREDAAPIVEEDGSWVWRIGPGSDQTISENFEMEGSGDITYEIERDEGVHHLDITPDSEKSFLLHGGTFSSIDGQVEISTDDFDGEFELIHHYQNPQNYQYLRFNGSQLNQGQVRNGSDNIMGSGQIDANGWFTLRVTASGMHYYGYQNGQTIVHTHDNEMEAGKTGLAFAGSGVLKIRFLKFEAVQ